MSTIAAISTSPGNSGIGIVRLSGEKSIDIINKIFKPVNCGEIKGYTIKYGNILDSKNEVIDEVLVSFFIAPKSYTGENMCEINSHGNNIVLKRILDLCIENGAELAEAGEFTKRAFLNGRIDLLQAEAVIDVINSKSELERKAAVKGLEGELSKKLKQIKAKILDILTDVEASIDYPEYDIEERSGIQISKEAEKIVEELSKLENSFERGKILRDGVSVAIVGKPNAGKSSLLNKILKEERAIVTDIEGTTRDTIEEFVNIKGITFKIIDTAGIRKADNVIEKIGIDKSKKALREADLIIAIFDVSKELIEEDIEILNSLKERNSIILLNKKDLNVSNLDKEKLKEYSNNILEVSIKENEGIEETYEKMAELFNVGEIDTENTSIITNIRHKQAIKNAKDSINQAIEVIVNMMPIDITAIYFKQGIEEINKITGENVTDDIINEIFSKFCLGKWYNWRN